MWRKFRAFALIAASVPDVLGFVMLDGPEVNEITERPGVVKRKPKKDTSDNEWKREMAMEAGMLGGIEAYNDYYS